LTPRAIKGRILTGPFKEKEVLIPKITLFHKGDAIVKFSFYRYQFPVALSFGMTINKCQGQIMNCVALVLENQAFAHGQLYVGLLQVRNVWCKTQKVAVRPFLLNGEGDGGGASSALLYYQITRPTKLSLVSFNQVIG
jgi:hypothetical protein